MKYIFACVFILLTGCKSNGQNKVYSARYFTSDTTFYSDTTMGHPVRIAHYGKAYDSSDWRLYKINNDTFYYFKIYPYALVNKPLVHDSVIERWRKECNTECEKQNKEQKTNYYCLCSFPWEWDDAVGRMVKKYMETNYLLPTSKITDTIPQEIRTWSEFANADNKNYEYGHTIIEYYVGGWFGEKVREIHLNDGKKRKTKNKLRKR